MGEQAFHLVHAKDANTAPLDGIEHSMQQIRRKLPWMHSWRGGVLVSQFWVRLLNRYSSDRNVASWWMSQELLLARLTPAD